MVGDQRNMETIPFQPGLSKHFFWWIAISKHFKIEVVPYLNQSESLMA